MTIYVSHMITPDNRPPLVHHLRRNRLLEEDTTTSADCSETQKDAYESSSSGYDDSKDNEGYEHSGLKS